MNKTKNDSSPTVTVTPTVNGNQVKNCTIPNSMKMSDMIGVSMKELAERYGATYKVYDSGYAANIMCENEKYKINIMSTQKDLVVNYVIMELKEFGYCTAGIENVAKWVDKSINAVGYNASTKGSARNNTENNMSQIAYDNYNDNGKKMILAVECNITGNYIGVNAILTK